MCRVLKRYMLRSQVDVRISFRVRERKDVELILGQGMLAAGWHAHTLNAPDKFLISGGVAQRIGLRPCLARRLRALALGRELAATGLARRPYDLRYAALSLWPSAGAPPAEVAARAGHSVTVLLSVYAHCVDGQDRITNRLIEEALGPRQLSAVPESKRFRGPPVPAQTLSAYLHRHVTASGFGDRPFSVLGRASLRSLALIAAGSCERAGGSGGAKRPAQRRRRRP